MRAIGRIFKPMLLASTLGALLLLSSSCDTDLPADFRQRPLASQVEAYEEFFRQGGLSSPEGRMVISSQGLPAADAMVPYLTREKTGIPVEEAVYVVWDVQLRGCSLRDSRAETALSDLVRQPLEEPLSTTVGATLESIRENRRIPELLDQFGAGACGETG